MGVCLSKLISSEDEHFIPVKDGCEFQNIEQQSLVKEQNYKTKFCHFSSLEIIPFENEYKFMCFEDNTMRMI